MSLSWSFCKFRGTDTQLGDLRWPLAFIVLMCVLEVAHGKKEGESEDFHHIHILPAGKLEFHRTFTWKDTVLGRLEMKIDIFFICTYICPSVK